MQVFNLESKHDGRKSFYNKAKVIVEGDSMYLQSYTTIVASITKGVLKVNGLYSNTTTRHIREFIKQFYGDSPLTLKELREHIGE